MRCQCRRCRRSDDHDLQCRFNQICCCCWSGLQSLTAAAATAGKAFASTAFFSGGQWRQFRQVAVSRPFAAAAAVSLTERNERKQASKQCWLNLFVSISRRHPTRAISQSEVKWSGSGSDCGEVKWWSPQYRCPSPSNRHPLLMQQQPCHVVTILVLSLSLPFSHTLSFWLLAAAGNRWKEDTVNVCVCACPEQVTHLLIDWLILWLAGWFTDGTNFGN